MSIFSELTSTLRVTEYKINVIGLDCIELGKSFEPTKDIIAINSNYIHKCFHGYDQFLSKPKSASVSPGKRGGLRGDRSTFNSCIEFTLNLSGTCGDTIKNKTTVIRYFPKSGSIQLFTDINIINIFLQYLKECGLSEFSSVELIDKTILLNNFKFNVILDSNKILDLSHLYNILETIKFNVPFPIKYIKFGKHSNIIILFDNKIRVHIWHSGKVNFFGTKDELSAKLIYDFLLKAFTEKN